MRGGVPRALQTYVTAMTGNLTKTVCTKRLINAAIVNGNKQYPNTQTLWKKLLSQLTRLSKKGGARLGGKQGNLHRAAEKF
jgi:hypothetical protein